MGSTSLFERLVESATMVARHAFFPGKGLAIERCLEDVEELTLSGRITVEQRDVLREVLLGSFSPAI